MFEQHFKKQLECDSPHLQNVSSKNGRNELFDWKVFFLFLNVNKSHDLVLLSIEPFTLALPPWTSPRITRGSRVSWSRQPLVHRRRSLSWVLLHPPPSISGRHYQSTQAPFVAWTTWIILHTWQKCVTRLHVWQSDSRLILWSAVRSSFVKTTDSNKMTLVWNHQYTLSAVLSIYSSRMVYVS